MDLEIDDMEIDEDEGELLGEGASEFSSALVVNRKDFENLPIPYEDGGGGGDIAGSSSSASPSASKGKTEHQFLRPGRPAPKRKYIEMSQMRLDESQEAEGAVSEEERHLHHESLGTIQDIRKATDQYLRGELPIGDFETLVDIFERYKQEYDDEPATETETGAGPEQPSLVLLEPAMVMLDASSSPHQLQHQHQPKVILSDPEPEDDTGNSNSAAAKLRGEFFRTGDDMATFTVRRKRKMSPTVKNMMGEAHVRFARGDLSGSESICLEIIKEQPTYKDPFHTLAMIYESEGKMKKALQFSIISGLLDPKGFEDWGRVAELSVKEGKIPQAIWCLTKAVSSDSGNVKIQLRRSELMVEISDYKGALRGYNKVLSLCENDGEMYMDVAKGIAGIHFKLNELDLAYDALSRAVNKFSDRVTTVELNLLVEVCISLKRYVKAVTLFMRFSGVKFEPSIPKGYFKERNTLMAVLSEKTPGSSGNGRKCILPVGLHADLVQKLCIVLIHLEAVEMVAPLVEKLKEGESLDSFGIQFYEIAEAYLAKQQYDQSLIILTTLVNSEKYNMAEIWLRYAECLFLLNRHEESAEAYSKVIELAPGHKIARLNLSVILQKLGKYDIALESLGQNDIDDLIDQDLLVEKCNILLSRNRIPEFYETALQLFSRHCPDIRNHDEAHALVITSQTNQMLEALRALRIRKGEESIDDDIPVPEPPTSTSGTSASGGGGDSTASGPGETGSDNLAQNGAMGEWTVYVNLIRTLLKMSRIDLFSRVVYTVWASPLFNASTKMKQDMDLHCCYATILNGDLDLAPLHLRSLIVTYGLSSIMFSLMSLACRKCGHTRYGRQILRLLMKRPDDTRLMMLSAHNSFMNGTYKYALMEYLALFRLRGKDPLLPLMIASTLIHIAGQKHTSNRSQLMMQAVAFVNKYKELRGDCQESFYNLGRFYHYLGIYRKAMEYYQIVLETEPPKRESGEREDETEYEMNKSPMALNMNMEDLKREAAFNISQIYKSCGQWQLAKQYIHRYVVI